MMIDLFSQTSLTQPLADRMRPQQLSEYVGQEHLLSDQGPIGAALLQGRMHSMILWGPPGVGKTTLAQVISNSLGYAFILIWAVVLIYLIFFSILCGVHI